MSKLELAVIVAVLVAGTMWIEREHRVIIEPPTQAEVAAAASAAACPESDNVPYSARCLEFLSGWYWRANASPIVPAPSRR